MRTDSLDQIANFPIRAANVVEVETSLPFHSRRQELGLAFSRTETARYRGTIFLETIIDNPAAGIAGKKPSEFLVIF